MELILCRVIESSCLPTHNSVPHISWHDLPCHMTTKNYSDFPSVVIFKLLLRKFRIQKWFCNCQQYLCLFHIVFEYIPDIHDQRKMLVLLNQCLVRSRINILFLSSQFYLSHPHSQMRIILFHGVRMSISNWKPSPNRISIGFSRNAFPITVLPKEDHTDFAQEERLGLPYWTMILAICVECLDIPIW